MRGTPLAPAAPKTDRSRAHASGRVCAVATPSKPPTTRKARRSKVEIIKEGSDFLRHPLMEELVSDKTFINEQAQQLMKFHGSYQQDHREKRAFGQGKFYQFMMRTRQPGGLVHWQLYVVMDDLADKYGSGTLRLTTRQTFQLHGVLKEDLKTVFSTVIKNMGSTLGACGDNNRNVLSPPAPYKNRPDYAYATQYAKDIADLLAPQSGAYYDVWLDGEKFVSVHKENPKVTEDRAFSKFGTNFEGSAEPIYGSQFLPRKFKIAITVPGDNSIDLLTNDIGLVVMCDDKGELQGFDVLVGGGMGRTHRNEDTFPRLADPLGYVDKDDVFHVVKAIVATQRDYGRRDDRKMARMKYLVASWGLDKFRSVVEQYFGKKFQAFKPLPPWKYLDYLGWGEQGDGNYYYGIHVQNGRVKGDVKKVLRTVIERYELPTMITANQNIVLTDIRPTWKADIAATLAAGGVVDVVELGDIERYSMACPALPLCGLAIGEAERGLPGVTTRLTTLMRAVGLPEMPIVVRMTGCPNGCARPYMAELGFVCDGPNTYQIWLGGDQGQTRLAQCFMDRMKLNDLETVMEPIFFFYSQQRKHDEGFGDFCARVGFDALRDYQNGYIKVEDVGDLHQVGISPDVYEKLEELAKAKGKTVEHVSNEVLRSVITES
ncbi:unnamed protein product [Ostreobium quekettii]|uniref:assimilatory sulfite reductase (ferredoxin) n=1 Tax=Ostreobium quekettii TaxID=121088 RepID=A0A8S1J5P6_9CHLO|nr:unnamed protein product [Ostreobium quekettii]